MPMTNQKVIFGLVFSVAVAAAMMLSQTAIAASNTPGYLKITESSATTSGNNLKVSVNTERPIPKDGREGAFGYGFLTNGLSNVLAVTTHLCASDSLVQGAAPASKCPNPVGISALVGNFADHDDETFHAHVLDLKPAGTECASTYSSADLEVDFASTVGSGNNVSPSWPTSGSGKKLVVEKINPADFDDVGVEAVVSFEILPIVSGTEITNLCIDVVGTGNGL